MRPLLQPGNSGQRGLVGGPRLDEHLGYYLIEGTRLRRGQSVCFHRNAVYGVTHLASLARLLPERDPHEDIYEMLRPHAGRFFEGWRTGGGRVSDPVLNSRWLAELRFRARSRGRGAATGATTDLVYVFAESPVGAVVAQRRRAVFTTVCCGCRPFYARARQAAAGWTEQDLRDGFCPDGDFFFNAPCAGARAGQGHSRCQRRLYQCR